MAVLKTKTNGKAKEKSTFGKGRGPSQAKKRTVKKKANPEKAKTTRQAIKEETLEKRERTYTIKMSEHDRYWIMTKLERIGAAKTPHEKRLLELIRNSKADGGK